VFVCDRANNRFQIFRKDGTFVKEVIVAKQARGPLGTVADLVFSPDDRFMYVTDTANAKIWILARDDFRVVGSVGQRGRYAGQLTMPHDMDIDSKGNVYVGESQDGRRVQKFVYKGIGKPS
jgi:sugar lactone lactonase YvrE